MINKILRILNLKKPEEPKYTLEYIDHPEEQITEVRCYKDGIYRHSINILYFTQEQIDKIQNS